MAGWDTKIQRAEKFLEKAHTHGKKVYCRYQDEREDYEMQNKKVNLFYSNVSTLKESLFNSLPKPDVSRMHKGDYEDDIARMASMIMQRALNYEVQCDHGFKESIEGAILDRLVPGIGQVWVRPTDQGKTLLERVYWEDFIYEPARCWSKVGWVGRRLALSKKDVESRWGPDAIANLQKIKQDDNTPKQIDQDKYEVYEIWNKRTREVIHTAKGLDEPLSTKPDPYGLPNFFPCPAPLVANPTTKAFLPVTDYHIAQDQYIQLDVLYARISLIIKAVKVAGAYDASEQALGSMLEGQENKLVPVDNWAMYAEKGGSRGMIDWYPVDQVVAVLQQLQASFEAIKAVLYEVTGMSDIIRGASNQYETASAQEIKAQFASVRMNGYQRDVSNFVSEILNIMGSMIANLYDDQKIMQAAGGFDQADMPLVAPALQVLHNNLLRQYKITIVADSLTQSDWAREKGQRMELVGYMSQFLQAAVPAATQFPALAPLLMSMLKFSVAGYKGAAELEGVMDKAIQETQQQGGQQPPNPQQQAEQQKMQMEQQKMQAEQMKLQMEMQMEQQKMKMEMQMEQQKLAMEAQIKQMESKNRMDLEAQQARADMAVEQQRMNNQREMHEMQMRLKELELAIKRETANIDLETKAVSAEIDMAKKESDARNADV